MTLSASMNGALVCKQGAYVVITRFIYRCSLTNYLKMNKLLFER